MPRRFPLQNLRELARIREEGEARALQTLHARLSEATEKLAELTRYREEYLARFRRDAQNGMSAGAMTEFRGFLARVDAAIHAQTAEVERRRERWETGRRRWMVQKHRLSAFDVLAERHRRSELLREDRIEQRDQDELAARSHRQGQDKQ